MSLRNIVKIDETRCNGCGLCVTACAEGAIQIVNGKARLVSETYCDGLGACLGHCPQGAIAIEQRESANFDEHAVQEHLARQQKTAAAPSPAAEGFVCPGMRQQSFHKPAPRQASASSISGPAVSELTHWPIQLKLISPSAKCLHGADLLLVADCVPFAMGDFHARFLKDRSLIIGCPKLDDSEFYADKLADILMTAHPKSLTVIHMEVPCCSGLTRIAQKAILHGGVSIPFDDITISLQGEVLQTVTSRK
jgi:Pyruvate/2-oxoacid:ferredoxin oxidoreductase delta subunit